MSSEIEKKYSVTEVPDSLEQSSSYYILQGYITDEQDVTEVRLRKADERYFLTVKKKVGGEVGNLKREEFEHSITREQFDFYWPLTKNRRVEKKRYLVEYKGLTIELDVYLGKLKGLITAEIEFTTEEESSAFVPPDWFSRDVTEDDAYKNRNLALHGLPSV